MALQHLRSNTASKRPTPASMADGQLAINTNATSPGLFFKDAGGALIKVGPVHVGTSAPNSSPAGSSGNAIGEQWLDTSGGGYVLKIWDGSAWRSEAGEFVDAAGDTMTGALILPSGTAAAPALGVGSTNNGFYAPVNKLAIATNGVGRVFIDNGGKVGIGAPSTSATLYVDGTVVSDTITTTGNLQIARSSIAKTLISDAGSYFTNDLSAGSFIPTGSGAPTNGMYLPSANSVAISTNGTGRLFVDANGNVGINATSPAGRLGVDGSVVIGNQLSTGTTTGTLRAVQSTSSVYLQTGLNTTTGSSADLVFSNINASNEWMRLTSAGRLGIGISAPSNILHVHTAGSNSSVVQLTNSTTGTGAGDGMQIVTSDSEMQIRNRENGALNFWTNNTKAVTIDTSQRVGIGSTTPQGDLSFGASVSTINLDTSDGSDNKRLALNGGGGGINSGRGGYIALSGNEATNPGNVQISMGNTSGTSIVFNKGDGSEVGRWDSSGRLLVGTSSARDNWFSSTGYAGQLQLETNGWTSASVVRNTNNASGPHIHLGKSRSASNGGVSSVFSGDVLGRISYFGADGTGLIEGARIDAFVDGTPGTNDMPGRLVFSTTADGASSPTERMRIDSAGNVGIGTSSPDGQLVVRSTSYSSNRPNAGAYVESSVAGDYYGLVLHNQDTDATGTVVIEGRLGQASLSNTSAGQIIFGKEGNWTNTTSTRDSYLAFTTTQNAAPSEKVRITSAGNVGIGTSSPGENLELGSTTDTATLRFRSTFTSFGSVADISCIGTANETSNLAFSTRSPGGAVTEKLRITNAGSVGIGTTSPSQILSVGSITGRIFTVNQSTANRTILNNDFGLELRSNGGYQLVHNANNSLGSISFQINSSERARIDSSGRLLVGTSTAPAAGAWARYARLVSNGNTTDSTGAGILNLAPGKAATSIANGNGIGVISFSDNGGNEFGLIGCFADQTAGSGDYPGRLVFSTTNDGSSSPTEKMRITETGTLTSLLGIYNVTTASAADVNISAAGTLRRSTSSSKYKSNVEEIDMSYSNALLNCRPVWYRSTCAEDNHNWGWWGFIAEEVAAIDPRLVHWKTVEVTYSENGSVVETPCDPEPEGVAYDRFVPHLLNLIKRQQQAIEELQTEVAALKAQ